MTNPVRSATRPSPMMALEQLVRHWSRVTAWSGGLLASDRDTAVKANLHTGPMPQLKDRLSPSCSFTISPSTRPATNEPTEHVGVSIEARGGTQDMVLALLQEFIDTVAKPGARGFAHAPRIHGGAFQLSGVIGAPLVTHFGAAADSTLGVFRIRRLDLGTSPQLRTWTAGVGGTDDGEPSAELTLMVVGTAAVMPKPIEAFTISMGGGTIGAVQIIDGQMILTRTAGATTTINLSAAADDTIGELFTHNVAPGFSFSGLNGAVSARASLDLVEIPRPVTVESTGSIKVYVWG